MRTIRRTDTYFRVIVAFRNDEERQKWLRDISRSRSIIVHGKSAIHPWVSAEVKPSALSALQNMQGVKVYTDARASVV
jgi:hypothetical protein